MNNFLASLPHLILSVVVIGAVTALAATNTITGTEALGVIGTAAGVALGGAVSSGSASAAAENTRATLTLSGGVPTTQSQAPPQTNVAAISPIQGQQ